MGELAHLSVPDLKEAEGGLRDATVLKALVATWLVDVPARRPRALAAGPARRPRRAARRRGPRDRPGRARSCGTSSPTRLGLADAAAAQRHVRELGRRITHLSRLTWRRVDGVLARPAPAGAARRPELAAGRAGRRRWPAARSCSTRDARPGRRPDAAAARRRRGGRARRRAGPGRPRPGWSRECAAAAAPVAGARRARRWSGCSRPARGCCRCGRPSRRPGALDAVLPGVGADPAAAARLGDPPVHRRPARGRDLHGGGRADPPGRRGPTCCWSRRCCTTSARAG